MTVKILIHLTSFSLSSYFSSYPLRIPLWSYQSLIQTPLFTYLFLFIHFTSFQNLPALPSSPSSKNNTLHLSYLSFHSFFLLIQFIPVHSFECIDRPFLPKYYPPLPLSIILSRSTLCHCIYSIITSFLKYFSPTASTCFINISCNFSPPFIHPSRPILSTFTRNNSQTKHSNPSSQLHESIYPLSQNCTFSDLIETLYFFFQSSN